MTKIRKDLLCENCQHWESTILLYWERYHQDSGRTSLINPSIICTECSELFNGNAADTDIPRFVRFDVIAKWDGRMRGLSSKKYEFSVFRNPYFKKKLWRIKFASQPEKDAKKATRTDR